MNKPRVMEGVTCAGCILMTMALIVCVQGQNSEQFDVCNVHVLRLVLFLKIAFVTVTLGGVHYANNSEVLLTDIGEGGNALLCLTNNTQCCRGTDNPHGAGLGEWYFPNGSTPRGHAFGNRIYRNRGPGVVQLNRKNDAQSPTGVYRCEIPDASGTKRNINLNLTLGTTHSAHFF